MLVCLSVSGLSGDASTAQSQVSVGMGLLAGSTVMLLTVIWGTCTVVGKCDLRDSVAVNNQDTKGFHLNGNEKGFLYSLCLTLFDEYTEREMKVDLVYFFFACRFRCNC